LAAANYKKTDNYKVARSRKIEKWSNVISQSNIDISKPINHITAKQIKQITNEDARLMAKIDKIENLPKIFMENNLFLLPISRKEYAIVKGKPAFFDSFPQDIKNIITKLRITVDHIDSPRNYACDQNSV
jgi:hypothetical protein